MSMVEAWQLVCVTADTNKPRFSVKSWLLGVDAATITLAPGTNSTNSS